jgi:molecular chaperone GrpE
MSDLDNKESPDTQDAECESVESAEPDPLRAAEARAEEAEKKAAEYLEMAQRLKADYENYRKRMLKEQTHHLEMASQGLVESLLPVLDAFDLALVALEQIRDSHPDVAKGIEMVYAELMGTLAKAGVRRIDEAGIAFDPHRHHALEHEGVREDGDEEIVLDVLRPGYMIKRHVLRPADVKVGYRKPAED